MTNFALSFTSSGAWPRILSASPSPATLWTIYQKDIINPTIFKL